MSYGSGIKLDEDWDFVVDDSGDIASTSEFSELEKDIAYALANRLDNDLGVPITPTGFAQLKSATLQILQRDQRIERIADITVEESTDENNTAVITADIIAVAEDSVPEELVIEV